MATIVHILIWGGILTFPSFVILMASWLIDPKMWGTDLGAPEEYQNRIGGLLVVLLLFAVQLPIMACAVLYFELIDPNVGFGFALVLTYAIFQIFNLADLILFDWLVYLKLKPAFMRPDYLPVADDLAKHIEDFRNGLIIGLLPALISTSLWYFFL